MFQELLPFIIYDLISGVLNTFLSNNAFVQNVISLTCVNKILVTLPFSEQQRAWILDTLRIRSELQVDCTLIS